MSEGESDQSLVLDVTSGTLSQSTTTHFLWLFHNKSSETNIPVRRQSCGHQVCWAAVAVRVRLKGHGCAYEVAHALAWTAPITWTRTSRELMDSVDTVSLLFVIGALPDSPASLTPPAPFGSLGRFCR